MGASRAELQVSFLGRIACPTATTTAAHSRHPRATSTLLAETGGQRRHRELVLRFLREISPQESISARHKTTKRGRHGSPHAWAATKVPSCGPDPAIAARVANLRAVPPQKSAPSRCGAKTQVTFPVTRRRRACTSLVYWQHKTTRRVFARSRSRHGPGVCGTKTGEYYDGETKRISPQTKPSQSP